MVLDSQCAKCKWLLLHTLSLSVSNTRYSARNCLQFLYQSWKQEGLLSLWRGNSATMARIIPYASIQYAAHEQYKRLLNRDRRKK